MPKPIPNERLAQLNRGEAATSNLMEMLAMDWKILVPAALPTRAADHVLQALESETSITRRMKVAGETVATEKNAETLLKRMTAHPSDIVRGWACYTCAAMERPGFPHHLDAFEVFADDPHFGVREWAWMALRPHLAKELKPAIVELQRWSDSSSVNLRRFTTELTRPRGVWCLHIDELKRDPALAVSLLEPLRADTTKYVQDSVANWLNDASKSSPDWVRKTVARWLKESKSPATERICRRAMRTLEKAKPNG